MKLLLLISCCISCVFTFSQNDTQNIYEADARIQLHDLRNYTLVFTDSTNKLSEKDITSGKFDQLFLPYSSVEKTIKPFTTYWLKVSVKPLASFSNWWIILRDTGNFYTRGTANDYVDVYTVNNRNEIVAHQRTGPFVPRSQKAVPQYTVVNCVMLSGVARQPVTLFIKMYNENSPGQLFYPQLQNPVVPIMTSDSGLDIMCAIALLFSLLSFFFYFFVRDKSYLLFGLFTLFYSQHYLILHPQAPFIDLYIPEHPWFVGPAFVFLTSGGLTIFLLFGRSFMNLRSLSYKTDRIVKWLVMIHIAAIIMEIIYMAITRQRLLSPWHVSIFMIATFFLTIRFAFFKTFEARVFVAGSLCLFGFSILGMMYNFQVVNLPFNPWPIGQMGQLLIYSFGLAYKIKLNEKAKAEAEHIKGLEEIKSKFFANISHEFRTPLTLIQGPLQQIEEQVNATGKNGVATVPLRQIYTMRRNTDRLLELVNQLLDLSRLDSGKMKLQIVKGDVLQLLKSLSASFDSMAERKQIHYHVHFPEQTHIAFFDKDKLEKIVVNLLSNAFKYTPEKGTVSVIVEMEDSRLRLSVEDNGPGIAKKELDKVFDRFYQVEGTEDRGTGIGLALVKELVDLYRGQISVSSEPGKGSRFRVSLPIDKTGFKENELVYGEWKSEENFISRTVDEKEETINKQSLGSLLPLLLVVEDNNDLRQFICETVQQQYQVTEAKNGKEGYEKAMAEIPDVIISDVMMPVMDGFAMTERIKKDERTSHIPVILLTAKAGQQHKIEGLETGADDYLTKPFDAKELLTRVSNLINQRKLLRKKFAGSIQLKPSEVSVKSIDEIFLTNVMQAIEKNMEEDEFGVEELAKKVTMSRSQLHRKLIALIDKSPSDLIRQTRLLRAKELLQKKASTPSEVAFKVGFNSHTYFSKCFKEEFGISPGEI
jgi:signal transduction histidine kinase/DNA-binding response OmpR family regulator